MVFSKPKARTAVTLTLPKTTVTTARKLVGRKDLRQSALDITTTYKMTAVTMTVTGKERHIEVHPDPVIQMGKVTQPAPTLLPEPRERRFGGLNSTGQIQGLSNSAGQKVTDEQIPAGVVVTVIKEALIAWEF